MSRVAGVFALVVVPFLLAAAPAGAASSPFGAPHLVRDIDPGPNSSYPWAFSALRDRALLLIDADTLHRQLWVSDGTPEGTALLAAPGLGITGGETWLLGPEGGARTFFVRRDLETRDLWSTDGTPEGTLKLLPAGYTFSSEMPAWGGVSPGDFWSDRSLLLFLAAPGLAEPSELWLSDGTIAGTHRVVSAADGEGAIAGQLASTRELAYFERWNGSDVTVWATDGTAAGTLPAIGPLPGGGRLFAADAATMLFFREAGGSGAWTLEIWRHRAGGPAVRIGAIERSLPPLLDTTGMFVLGTRVVFSLRVGVDTELLSLDPSTGALEPLHQSTESTRLEPFAPMTSVERTGRLLFVVESEGREDELWSTDGTQEGTLRLFDECADACDRVVTPVALPGGAGFEVYSAGLPDRLFLTLGTAGTTRAVPNPCAGPACAVAPIGGHDFGRYSLLFARGEADDTYPEIWQLDGRSLDMTRVSAFGQRDWSPGPFVQFGRHLLFSANGGDATGQELWGIEAWPTPCQPDTHGLCLESGRFEASADWIDFQGAAGAGHAVPLSSDTGYFWFFDAANVELVAKALDGTGVNAHHWLFYGALSNVDFEITVADRVTGQIRRYHNPIGTYASVGDVNAFPQAAEPGREDRSLLAAVVEGGAAAPLELAGTCTPSPTRLCLQQQRFAVEATWRDFQGNEGVGTATALSADTGYFWFFADSNVEAIVKVLDGRSLNDRFWVYYGALSNVAYTLRVTDTLTGDIKVYENPAGRFASVGDNDAF